MNKNLNIGVVGAGIQGISNALFLQKKGFKVTIFDREKPGSCRLIWQCWSFFTIRILIIE